MSFEVIWSPAAEAALVHFSNWRAAERTARAVYQLAQMGRGDLRRIGTSQTEFNLYVGSCCVRLSLERSAKRIIVWHAFVLR